MGSWNKNKQKGVACREGLVQGQTDFLPRETLDRESRAQIKSQWK